MQPKLKFLLTSSFHYLVLNLTLLTFNGLVWLVRWFIKRFYIWLSICDIHLTRWISTLTSFFSRYIYFEFVLLNNFVWVTNCNHSLFNLYTLIFFALLFFYILLSILTRYSLLCLFNKQSLANVLKSSFLTILTVFNPTAWLLLYFCQCY